MIKVAIIGFGGISKVHYNGYLALKAENVPVELVAVCDVNPERFDIPIKTNLDVTPQPLAANIRTYTDVNELLAKEDFDMADICLPTYLHKEYAVQMLNAGKHVLCEKPMALNAEECDEMIDYFSGSTTILWR